MKNKLLNMIYYPIIGIFAVAMFLIIIGLVFGSLYVLISGTYIFTGAVDIVVRVILAIIWCGFIGYEMLNS